MTNVKLIQPDLSQLKRLVIFAKVVELGSFSQAAKALNLNRSGVSEQVALLEKYLNTQLLHRTTRTLSLTTEGEQILQEANQIAQSLQTVHDKLLNNDVSGIIRINATHDFAIHWLSPKLKVFQQQYPDIAFDLVLSDSPIDLLEQKIDLALHIGSSPDDSSLISEPLLREHLQIFASPEFLNNYSNTDSLEDLLKMPWILLKQMMNSKGLPLLSTNSSINFNLNPPRAHRVDSPIVMIEQIKMGLGVGLVFPSIVHREIKNGELVQILPDWHSNEMLFSVLYSTRRQMPIRVKTFLDFLTA